MEQVTRTLTSEQQEAILQSFRDLIRKRLELMELISWIPSEAQQIEMLRNAPTSLEELNARFAKEQATLAADPDARAIYEERQAAHEANRRAGEPRGAESELDRCPAAKRHEAHNTAARQSSE
ncbi:MAG TPA: hypothetical protein VJ790_00320 [Dongiaceae bacterium]|nr:hypothetical protein [Dongiaceae bacterium]